MKEFINALKYSLLFQIGIWLTFFLFDEYKFVKDANISNIAMIIGIVLLIITLVLYFVFGNKIIRKNKFNSKKFNLSLFFIWLAFQTLLYFLFNPVMNIIRPCEMWGCILVGFEYFLQWLIMTALPVLILIINLIIKLYKYIKNKKTK